MADEDYTGRVVTRLVNKGSKSEHTAVFLESEGGSLRITRSSGPPFHDPVLARLAGHDIRCQGHREHGRLVLSSWRKIKPKST